MIRAVLDSNVIASGLMSLSTPPGVILRRAAEGTFTPIVTERLFLEYQRALAYPRVRSRIRFDDIELRTWLQRFRRTSLIVQPAVVARVVERDPDDDMVIACAVGGRAAYIVTGDKQLQALLTFEGIEIVSPATFIHELLVQGY